MSNQNKTAIETAPISLNYDKLPLKRSNCKTSNLKEGKQSHCIFLIEGV